MHDGNKKAKIFRLFFLILKPIYPEANAEHGVTYGEEVERYEVRHLQRHPKSTVRN